MPYKSICSQQPDSRCIEREEKHTCRPTDFVSPSAFASGKVNYREEANPDGSLQSAHENRIYSLKMHCGEKYPDEPPSIQFVSQVNLPCVNPHNGVVDPKQLPCLAQWKRENTMEMVLIELRRWALPSNKSRIG